MPVVLAGLWLLVAASPVAAECTYNTYSWDTRLKKSVNHTRVSKDRSELLAGEIDQETGCSVCEQDQRWIAIAPLAPFRVCYLLAAPVEGALRRLIEQGEPIRQVIGYRVGKTRGETDNAGLRTVFSNHSYGVAIDINPSYNGLYDRCIQFGPSCRLLRGGHWNPSRPESLTADSPVVLELEALGLRWGGVIEGRQKDFMHFSPSGY